jgi:monoamine oxidase
MNRPYSRRQAVAALGGVAAALTGGRAAGAGRNSYDVAIIGAGLAGLNAALILTELGARVVVLEADTHSGGRCLTMDRWFLTPDLGGAQIGRDYARVIDVANRLNVRLGPGAHINAPYSFVLGGVLVPADKWADSPLNKTVGAERNIAPHALGGYYVEGRTPFKTLDGWLTDDASAYDISLAAWLDRLGASEEARRIIRASQGRPLEELSVLRMMQEATRAKIGADAVDAERLRGKDAYERAAILSQHVVGGTSRLTDAMSASLGDRLQLRKRVVAIDMTAGNCELRCADGSRFRARYTLAAVPFSVLRAIAVTPGLRGEQLDAVRRMPYGNQSQVWLRVKSPYWEADGIDASMWTDGALNLIRQQIESDRSRQLISALAFSENSRKLDAMPPAERGRFAIAEIERIRPSTRGQLEFVGAHSWEQTPTIRGCSHQYVPGKTLAWARVMGKPHDHLHFAGEHLRTMEVGMEAAMESGERAAREIAERLEV